MNERGSSSLMRIDVSLAPGEIAANDVAQAVVVVIDVLRATSTIAVALNNGCEEIIAAESIEEAINIASGYTRSDYVLGGGEAFPSTGSIWATPRRIRGSQGPRQETDTGHHQRNEGHKGMTTFAIYAASFLNADAVFRTPHRAHRDRDIILVCSGQDSRFCMEDALCAGLLASRFEMNSEQPSLIPLTQQPLSSKSTGIPSSRRSPRRATAHT